MAGVLLVSGSLLGGYGDQKGNQHKPTAFGKCFSLV